jgi:hypothetical protein
VNVIERESIAQDLAVGSAKTSSALVEASLEPVSMSPDEASAWAVAPGEA